MCLKKPLLVEPLKILLDAGLSGHACGCITWEWVGAKSTMNIYLQRNFGHSPCSAAKREHFWGAHLIKKVGAKEDRGGHVEK